MAELVQILYNSDNKFIYHTQLNNYCKKDEI